MAVRVPKRLQDLLNVPAPSAADLLLRWKVDGSVENVTIDTALSKANTWTPSAASLITLRGNVGDSASAVGVVIDNANALSTSGAKLLSIRNNSVEKAYFDKDGGLATSGYVAASKLWAQGGSNMLAYSQDFTQAVWGAASGNLTVTANATTAPDNTNTAQKLCETAATGYHFVQQGGGNGGLESYSVYAKAAERRRICIRDASVGALGVFDLVSGTVVASQSATAYIQSVGNGWYRCSVVAPNYPAGSYLRVYLAQDTDVFISSYAGVAGSGVYVWGAQIDGGPLPFPTHAATTASANYMGSALYVPGGVLGLGTQTPSARLHAYSSVPTTAYTFAAVPTGTAIAATVTGGSGDVPGLFIQTARNTDNTGPYIQLAHQYGNTGSGVIQTASHLGQLRFTGWSNGDSAYLTGADLKVVPNTTWATGQAYGAFVFSTANGGTATTQRMYIAPDGSVAIGTSLTPSAGFHVKSVTGDSSSAVGTILDTPSYTTTGAKLLSVRNGGSEKFYVRYDGLVAAALSIQGLNVVATNGTFIAGGTNSVALNSPVSDGASAIATKFTCQNALTVAGAKIASFYGDNGVTQQSFVTKDGDYVINSGNISLKTAANMASLRFMGY